MQDVERFYFGAILRAIPNLGKSCLQVSPEGLQRPSVTKPRT